MRVVDSKMGEWLKDLETNKHNRDLVKYIYDWTSAMEMELDLNPDKTIDETLKECAHKYEMECDHGILSGAMFNVLVNRVIYFWEYGSNLDKLYEKGFWKG